MIWKIDNLKIEIAEIADLLAIAHEVASLSWWLIDLKIWKWDNLMIKIEEYNLMIWRWVNLKIKIASDWVVEIASDKVPKRPIDWEIYS